MSISNILINDTKAPFKTINCKSLTCDEFSTDTFTANTINSVNINSENLVSENIAVTSLNAVKLEIVGKQNINTTVPILNSGIFTLEERVGQITATMSGFVLGPVSLLDWTFFYEGLLPSNIVIISIGSYNTATNAPLQSQLSFCLKSITNNNFVLNIVNQQSGSVYTGNSISFSYMII
jgi:hypothetical protein